MKIYPNISEIPCTMIFKQVNDHLLKAQGLTDPLIVYFLPTGNNQSGIGIDYIYIFLCDNNIFRSNGVEIKD